MKKIILFFCLTFVMILSGVSSTAFAQTNSVAVRDAIFTYDNSGNVTIARNNSVGKYLYDEFLELVGDDYNVTSIKLLHPIYAIEENTFIGSSDTLKTVDLPSSVYSLEENIFGSEHNVKVRFAGNEELWQDVYRANDDNYYGNVEFLSRGYAGISDAYFTVTENGIVMDLVYAFAEKNCVAEVKLYSYDDNGNKFLDKTYTFDMYVYDNIGCNFVETYNLDFVPDGKNHTVDITLYNNLTAREQWGDVCKCEFFAYNTPCAVEYVDIQDYDSKLSCNINFAFVRENSVAHIEIFDYNDEGELVPNKDMVVDITAGTTRLEQNIPFKFDNKMHLVKVSFYDNMTDKNKVSDTVTHKFCAYQDYVDVSYEYIDTQSVKITQYTGYGGETVLPSKISGYVVKEIAESAFECSDIETIVIPDTITKIGNSAFAECMYLSTVNYVGTEQEWNNINIEENNTTLLTSNIFFDYIVPVYTEYYYNEYENKLNIWLENCYSDYLAEVEILNVSQTETSKIYYEIEQGTQQKNINLPRLNYGDTYRLYCSIVSEDKTIQHTIPCQVAYFTAYANMETFIINDFEYYIDDNDEAVIVAYYGEDEQLVIPDTIDDLPVTTLYSECLYGSHISTLVLGKNLVNIGDGALSYCYNLKSIVVDTKNPYLTFENGVLYDKSKTKIIQYLLTNNATHFDMPDSVTVVGSCAFEGANALQTISFSENIKKIGKRAFAYSGISGEFALPDGLEVIGSKALNHELTKIHIPDSVKQIADDAFYEIYSLEQITVDQNNSAYSAQDGVLYNKSKTALIKYPTNKSNQSFTIPSTVKEINSYAFYDGSDALTQITIPNSVKVIKEFAFGYQLNVSDIYFTGTEDEWQSILIEQNNGVLDYANIIFSDNEPETPETPEVGGRCGDNAFWKIDANGVLTIYGSGELYELIGSNYIPWYEHTFTKLVVENGIENIPDNSFANSNLESAELADSVTYIGECAFSGCESLEMISNSSGVKHIGDYAFSYCTKLESIEYSHEITYIGECAFIECKNLKGSIVIPDTITSFGANAFSGCEKIEEVTFNAPVKISPSAFSDCNSLKKATISDGATGIEYGAFQNCENLKTVSIPGTVSVIGETAFWNCVNLETLTISKGVKTIEYMAFEGCQSITSISIPSSVKTIGERAFNECKSAQLTIAEGVTTIGDNAFSWCTGITQLTIPNSVTSIGNSAFSACTGMTQVTIPNSVTSIGSDAFALCSSLTNVTLDAQITTMENVFRDCTSLKKINLPKTLVHIGNSTFYKCTSLADIEFPEGLSHIGDSAFEYSGLESVIIPETVVEVGNYAFYNCANLKSVNWQSRQSRIGDSTFGNCDSLETVKFGTFLKEIGKEAFSGCEGLKELDIPGNIHTIMEGAFKSCTGLETLILQEGVTTIENYAFNICTNLNKVIIPKSLEYVGWYGFELCDNVTDIYYAGGESGWENIYVWGSWPFHPPVKIHYNYNGFVFPEPNTNVNIDTTIDNKYMPQKINEVTIIEKGTAYGRFLVYSKDGRQVASNYPVIWSGEGTGVYEDRTNEDGYITVAIPDVTESGEYKFKFRGEYIREFEGIVNVTVEPLHFQSGFEAVFKAGLSVGGGLGAGAQAGGYGAEAKLAEVGMKGSKAVGLAFTQEHLDGKNNLIFSSSVNTDTAVYGKAGLLANVSQNDIPGISVSAADISGEISFGTITTVGYEDDDFDIKNSNDIKDVAKFLIVASVQNNISNVLAQYIAEKIEAPVNYFEKGHSLSMESGSNIGLIESAGAYDTKVAMHSSNVKSTWTNSTKKYKDNSHEYTTSLQLDGNSNIFEISVGVSEASVPVTGIRSISNKNLSISAKEDNDGNIESYTLSTCNTNGMSMPFYHKKSTSVHEFEFSDNGAIMIENSNDILRYLGHGNKAFLSSSQLKNATETILKTPWPGKYSNTTNVSVGDEIDLSVSFDLGVELGLNLGIGGYYNYNYENQNGIIENGTIYMQAENDIDELVEEEILTPAKIVNAAKSTMKDMINEVLEKVESWVDETGKTIVANGKAIAKSINKTSKKYKLYISTATKNMGIARVLAVQTSSSDYSTSSIATTIGNPYVVSMLDDDGNQITDFSDEPVLLEIEYTEEDLYNANVTDVNQISILRWDEEKCVYVNMGGNVDTDSQKLTLEITLPGQYILGTDNCEPAITMFSQNHTGKTPVISAYVSDMSGIEELTLELDGKVVVDMNNLDKYYNYTTGLLKYQTDLAESGKYIFTIYAKDTFGNDITQNYSIEVNDDVPTIDNVKVLDKNSTQAQTVTANVSGNALTSVFLNTYVKKASGEAYQLSVDMVQENGVYTAKVPVIENASVAEIWISAYNSFGNKAESAKQICLVDSKSSPAVYIHSISDGNVNVECTNLDENGKIYLAVYDENGILTSVYSKDITNDTLVFENTATGDHIKAFAWDDNMLPQCHDFTVNVKQ